MNRKDLATAIAQRTDLTDDQANAALGALTDVLAEAVGRGDRVQLPGAFTLERVERAARSGRNPRTGEPISIPAQHTARLTPAAALKAAAKA